MENFTAENYHKILSKDFPEFLNDYIQLPLLSRLKNVSLLCGTDFTPLFHNHFKYSRLEHSLGVALITWNFTHNKKQTLASLLHDVSTPAFSHVSDFRNGDALTQESTENLNKKFIDENPELKILLAKDKISCSEVDNYHIYPICDNECPGLSADRLEYMYPSGAALDKVWNLSDVKKNYSHILVLKNEKQFDELGFDSEEEALLYTKKFCDISLILQHNEDKIAMQLMADILSCAIKNQIVNENDFYEKSETELMKIFDDFASSKTDLEFSKLFWTYTNMTEVIHSEEKIPDSYCISLKVKKRYVDPLVMIDKNSKQAKRISQINQDANKCIKNFLAWEDSKFACVKYFDEDLRHAPVRNNINSKKNDLL